MPSNSWIAVEAPPLAATAITSWSLIVLKMANRSVPEIVIDALRTTFIFAVPSLWQVSVNVATGVRMA